ncbi:MAG: hypothetical protein U1E78_00320 [Gammaproteobacteria bacterium]
MHPAQPLIDKINSVNAEDQAELLEFARFCKKFQDDLDVNWIHHFLNAQRLKEGKDEKKEMEIGVDEKITFRAAMVTDYLKSHDIDDDSLTVKIEQIDGALYKVLSKAFKNKIDGIECNGLEHGEVTAVMTAFQIAKHNQYQFPKAEEDPKLVNAGEYIRDRIEKAEKAEKAVKFLAAAELKVAKEIARYRQASNAPQKGIFHMSPSRSRGALAVLEKYKSQLLEARTAVMALDPTAKDFKDQLDEKLIDLSKKAEVCYNHPAIKKAPSTHRLFQWILDGLESAGLYRSKASEAAVIIRSNIDSYITENKREALFTNAERKAVQEVLLLDKRLQKLNQEKPEQVDDAQKIAFESFGIKVRTKQDIETDKRNVETKKEMHLENAKTKTLYEAIKVYDEPKQDRGIKKS